MIVDSSAVVAILRSEPETDAFIRAIGEAGAPSISVATFFETAIVIDSRNDPVASRELDKFVKDANMNMVSVDERQARIARAAYRDFGKGSGHPARLNFGDCFAYALAKVLDKPLLYMGTDFSNTDVRSALI
ncbi:MAG: type II toxin-antitoxin system VapC family toxin [Alphaproteobacteria bacterium]|nr:type II toxin-antitoxin system VapC family toxin [Alphaproteobacteria bacterium]